jgi:heme-degrading monooxygenase HmoA
MRSRMVAGVLALMLVAAAQTAEAADVRVFVRHEIGDYAAWRSIYEGNESVRKKMGVIAHEIYRSLDNPNEVTVIHEFKTLEKARAWASSSELKAALQKAGVTGTPQIWFTTRAGK